jgi:acyl carrier protein
MLRVVSSVPKAARRLLSSSSSAVPAACYLPSEEVTGRVINVVRSFKSAPPVISPECSFGPDLEFDSMMMKELVERLGEEFCVDIPASNGNNINGVKEAVAYFSAHPKAR